jgi:tRNA-modifying protein YgfZ
MSSPQPGGSGGRPPGPARPSPLLAWNGAVEADGPDRGVAAHYGDPYAEQRSLALGWGVVDRSARSVVRITGPDRLTWLHSLTTQQLEKLGPGESAQALVLSPQGHVEHHLTLTDDGTATWAHVEPGTAAGLIDFLTSMRFMLRVETEDVTAEYAVLTVKGPDRPDPHGATAAAKIVLGDEADLILPRSGLADAVTAARDAGGGLAGMWAYEALRIAAGRPRAGLDTDHRTIPHEVGWIGTAVHLNKGCYRGQETVARVHNLGHPPRRLVLLHLDGSEDRLPRHGEPVQLGGGSREVVPPGQHSETAVGFVGSSARHYELGPIALALVKRTVPVDETLTADGIAAAQEVIVLPDAGANVQITLRRPRGDTIGRPRE